MRCTIQQNRLALSSVTVQCRNLSVLPKRWTYPVEGKYFPLSHSPLEQVGGCRTVVMRDFLCFRRRVVKVKDIVAIVIAIQAVSFLTNKRFIIGFELLDFILAKEKVFKGVTSSLAL